MAGRRNPPRQRGVALLIFLILVVIGGLTFLLTSMTPEAAKARRDRQTQAALVQARDALLGYAAQFRDLNPDQATGVPKYVYGYLPLPDIGSSRINTTDPNCKHPVSGAYLEGCDAANFSGNGDNITVIGRFPWRKLGIEPLRDGWGECLWYAVSGSHQDFWKQTPMNWDTLGQLNPVVATSGAELASSLASAHDRPVAVIFSPGPPLPGQDRSPSVTDDVSQCGGNYTVRNYLDPGSVAMGATTNYFADDPYVETVNPPPHNAPINQGRYASPDPGVPGSHGKIVNLSAAGTVERKSDSTLWANGCPQGSTCTTVANDRGLALTGDTLFGALRKSSYFRTDINSMLDRMVGCLRDDLAAGSSFRPVAMPDPPTGTPLTDPASPPYKASGRIYSNTCYDDTATTVNTINPKGYFTHYRDQLFVAACPGAIHSVNGTTCAGALIFSGQRDTAGSPQQSRATATERNTPSMYLENGPAANANNLAGFAALQNLDYASCTAVNAGSFAGDMSFSSLSAGQTSHQDIVRCIPAGASLAVVAPTVATATGAIQLASYLPATRMLTLGSAAIGSNYGASPAGLFACAWTPEAHASGTGFRSYFRFRIQRVGEGFAFAVIDGDRNGSNVCGAARQHLGYSGNNGITPYIQWPKLAVEFDTLRNRDFSEPATLSNGRNDPCYQSSCGSTQNLASNAHVAVVYWGYGAADGTIPVSQPQEDDNVHGFPWPPDSSPRPAPRNPYPIMPYPTPAPDPAPGVVPLDRMGATSPAATASAKREFHARIEVGRSFNAPIDPKNGATSIQIQVWIEPHSAVNISAMTYNAGSPPTLTVSAASHGFDTGDIVIIKDAVPIGFNGEYTVTRIDANNFTATLPTGTSNPGRYISAISWADVSGGTDRAVVTSANHGLNSGDPVTIAGAIPTEYNGTYTITRIDANSYRFGLELAYEPGDLSPAIAAARALTPRAMALANTTRPMSQLDPAFKPLVTDAVTIHDEQTNACAASAPLCPAGQSCGSDGMCYRPAFTNLRLGFTIGERVTSSTSTAREQLIEIRDQATTWLE